MRAFVDAAGGLETAGYCRTNHWTGAFANSAGQALTGESAEIEHGRHRPEARRRRRGAAASARLADIDGARLGARAAAKARAGADPVELPPGRYEVVLEPARSPTSCRTSLFGFNAKAVDERRSFGGSATRSSTRRSRSSTTPLAAGYVFDAEGTPQQRLVLVDGGTTVAVTHDRRTAAEAGADVDRQRRRRGRRGARSPATCSCRRRRRVPGDRGHEVDGPVVDRHVAELVAGVERGVLVTDFWYTRVLDPRTLAVTGLTRNGVWLIEDGEVTRPLRNFRFTQSYAQALMPGNVLGVGAAAIALPDSWVPPRWTAPALRLASWNFTGGCG